MCGRVNNNKRSKRKRAIRQFQSAYTGSSSCDSAQRSSPVRNEWRQDLNPNSWSRQVGGSLSREQGRRVAHLGERPARTTGPFRCSRTDCRATQLQRDLSRNGGDDDRANKIECGPLASCEVPATSTLVFDVRFLVKLDRFNAHPLVLQQRGCVLLSGGWYRLS